MQVFSSFDSGSGEVISVDPKGTIVLAYKDDAGGVYRGWAHLRLTGVRGLPLKVVFANAGTCNYARGFETLQMVASYDGRHWFRVLTSYDGIEQVIRFSPERDTVYIANNPAYGHARHLAFVAEKQADPRVAHDVLGTSLDGRPIDRLRIGQGAAQVWIMARQHPCEPMANWFVEGFMDRLLDAADGVSMALLDAATFNVVPMVNPDGVTRGYMRTNAAGRDLNREWANASIEHSPEVHCLLAAMQDVGVSVLLDIHGDEFTNHTYAYGLDNPPSGDTKGPALLRQFLATLERVTPEFRAVDTYSDAPTAQPNMTMGMQQVVSRFGCLGVTIEMPFNDTARAPHPVTGWGIDQSRHFGAATLQALYECRADWL